MGLSASVEYVQSRVPAPAQQHQSWVWWCGVLVPVLKRQRQAYFRVQDQPGLQNTEKPSQRNRQLKPKAKLKGI